MEIESVSIRTTDLILETICAITIFLLSVFLIFTIAGWSYNNMISSLIVCAVFVVGAYLANSFSKSDTVLSIREGSMIIESQTAYFSISRAGRIPLEQIKAYEIHKTRIRERLVIYRINQSPVTLILNTLSHSDRAQLTSFLDANKIIPVKQLGTLSGQSFTQAFSKVLFTLLSGAMVFLAIYVSALYALYRMNSYIPAMGILMVFSSLILLFIVLYFTITPLCRKYRFHAYGSWILMSITLLFIAYGIQDKFEAFLQRPISISETPGVKQHPYQKFFQIGDFHCDTTLTGYYKSISSGGRRSRDYIVDHCFTSPVITSEDSPQNLLHEYWISNNYKQRINKNLNDDLKDKARINYMNIRLHDFNSLFKNHPAFFEVMFSELNPRARNGSYLFSVLSIGRTKSPLVILRPHSENFEVFAGSARKLVSIILSVSLGLVLLGAFVIARNR